MATPAVPPATAAVQRKNQRQQDQTDALHQSAGLEENISFIRRLSYHHDFGHEADRNIEASLAAIISRKNDPHLYLGVVGEFSSGKSTLLNALMRDDLLRTDVLQATTSVVTWMQYGEEIDFSVETANGTVQQFRKHQTPHWAPFKDFFKKLSHNTQKEFLRAFIHAATAEEAVASELRSVTIYHPSEAFRRGCMLCDIPGANSENPRHVKVAAHALRERCDAALVVIPADIPVSESLLRFLREHLAEIAHRCVYVVTKLDLIRKERERPALLKTIKARLTAGLGIQDVQLVACAPRVFLDDAINGVKQPHVSDEQQEVFVQQFADAQEYIWRSMEANREFIQVERQSILMSRLLAFLHQQLLDLEKTYKQPYERLLKNPIQDLAVFVARVRPEYVDEFLRRTSGVKPMINKHVYAARDLLLKHVSQVCKTKIHNSKELKVYINESFHADFKKHQERLVAKLAPIFNEMWADAQALIKAFECTFKNKKEYRRFETLDKMIQIPDNTSGLKDLIDSTALSCADTTNDNWFGRLIDWLFLSFEDEKQKALQKINASTSAMFDKIFEAVDTFADQHISAASASIHETIDQYVVQYDSLVKDMIARDEMKKAELERNRRQVQGDQLELERRQAQQEAWRQSMRARATPREEQQS